MLQGIDNVYLLVSYIKIQSVDLGRIVLHVNGEILNPERKNIN